MSKCKWRKTSRVSSRRATAKSDDEDPLSSEQVEIELEIVQKNMVSVYFDFTAVTTSTTFEVELLRQLHQENKKGLERDSLMDHMWKTVKDIFTCVALSKEILQLEPRDFSQLESWLCLMLVYF